MSEALFPFSYDGAIFYYSDFDAKKLLIYILEQIRTDKKEIDILKNISYSRPLTDAEISIIKIVMGDEIEDKKMLSELNERIVKSVVDDLIADRRLDGNEYIVRYFDGSEQAVFVSDDRRRRCVKDCFFITVPSVFTWRIEEYNGPQNVKETVEYIRRALIKTVSDDIDWSKRLGNLYGIYRAD